MPGKVELTGQPDAVSRRSRYRSVLNVAMKIDGFIMTPAFNGHTIAHLKVESRYRQSAQSTGVAVSCLPPRY
ncbi:MAG: hypothetical protein AAF609_07740 [Cyanobacteria bacterium P01_C01_bin.120]